MSVYAVTIFYQNGNQKTYIMAGNIAYQFYQRQLEKGHRGYIEKISTQMLSS